jgi:ABC-type multidrug transport system fused ATPase/permease subunit
MSVPSVSSPSPVPATRLSSVMAESVESGKSAEADALTARYLARERTFRAEAEREAGRSRLLSRIRLGLFALFALCVALAVASPAWRAPALYALAAGIVIFVIVAVIHNGVEKRHAHQSALADLNRESQDRIARNWSKLPEPSIAVEDDHPYAGDLDLTGHASLLHLIGPPNTPAGRQDLANWLLRMSEFEPDEVLARQTSVRELAPRLDERQELQAAGIAARKLHQAALDSLLAWAESESWLFAHPWVTIAACTLTLATIGLIALAYAEVVGGAWWVLTSTLGWLLLWRVTKRLNASFDAASGEYALRDVERVMALAAALPVESPLLVEARRTLRPSPADGPSSADGPSPANGGRSPMDGASSAEAALASLRRRVTLVDFRLTPLFYAIGQSVVLWDLHAWWWLERWKRQHGRHLREWLAAIGRIEALMALAGLAHDQPDWAFPIVERGRDRFAAEDLGHPLLRDAVRVTNDVAIGPPGTFLLITGSNMAGKSTLLRAIGLNAILAHAGAPVCARSLTMPPLTLYTSMRVSDSLELGLSLFMTSLLRLKRVMDAARAANPSVRPVLYLLDEVLQGTNSAERQIAVRIIVGHLVKRGALGVVTTHDLELAASQDFSARADSRHLTEHVDVEGDELKMTFDYKLRPGPATSGNALNLVRMLGLDHE